MARGKLRPLILAAEAVPSPLGFTRNGRPEPLVHGIVVYLSTSFAPISSKIACSDEFSMNSEGRASFLETFLRV
jgi:hypothetical protein